MKEKIIILYGGRSAERKVSVMSAENVVKSVDYKRFSVETVFISKAGHFYEGPSFEVPSNLTGYQSLLTEETISAEEKISPASLAKKGGTIFPVLHGPMGEDGSIQGFLEILNLPYAGPSKLFAAVSMDKLISKDLFSSYGLPQVNYVPVFAYRPIEDSIFVVNANLTYPLFVKPANMGSSVGISKVVSQSQLKAALITAFQFDERVIVEEGLDAPREIECAILGNGDIKIAGPGEVSTPSDFYDYAAKYEDDALSIDVPAKLPAEMIASIKDYAMTAYLALGGQGMGRCDFFLDETGQIFINEINAIPGFTEFSMYPMLWEEAGLSKQELISRLVDLGKEAFEARTRNLQV